MKINKMLPERVKNPGISLMISLGTSTLVLMGAMYTIISVQRSLENSANIERSTQLFFAAESGIEASFFHHNARGVGIDFITKPAPSSQIIDHPGMSAQTSWWLEGRTDTSNDNSEFSLMGILKSGQSVQVPLYWDTSPNPTVVPNNAGSIPNTRYIGFAFYDSSDAMEDEGDGSVAALAASSASKKEFLADYGIIPPITTDFGSADTEILIDWSFARKHNIEGIQTFSPVNNVDCLGTNKGFICDYQLSLTNAKITSTEDIEGRILPGNDPTTLDVFLNCAACSDYSLSFRSLLSYENSMGEQKIMGIPYEIFTENTEFPKGKYKVDSTVTMGDFTQSIGIEVSEKTSIGAFDYVIFD